LVHVLVGLNGFDGGSPFLFRTKLRRHAHYPLCYREGRRILGAGLLSQVRGCCAVAAVILGVAVSGFYPFEGEKWSDLCLIWLSRRSSGFLACYFRTNWVAWFA